MRITKYLSLTEQYSRRQIDLIIKDHRVTINGKVCEHQDTVLPSDLVCIDQNKIEIKEIAPIYLAFHKPRGIICTANKEINDNIIDYINYESRIFPIGRLDKDTEGLIILTNDGSIVNKIMHSDYEHEKEYIVKVDYPITELFVERMKNGVSILGTVTKNCEVQKINDFEFRIILTQGLNRQIRRMTKRLGYEVIGLRRVRIMNIELGQLQVGTFRHLTEEEITDLFAQLK